VFLKSIYIVRRLELFIYGDKKFFEVTSRKQPLRRCVGCHKIFPKSCLLRIAKVDCEKLLIDREAKACGRGAYICNSINCLLLAKKQKAFERTFKIKSVLNIYDLLNDELVSGESSIE
jgi:predicted RNA-binding protein YlxR (DUF448 family)